MRAKILLISLLCFTYSFGQKCPIETNCELKKPRFIKVAHVRYKTIFVDMGGASAHSTYEIMTRSFKKWLFFETGWPRTRHVYNVTIGTLKVETLSNNDTGNDYLAIYADGDSILETSFGEEGKFYIINFNFDSPKTLTFRVSNHWTLNNSPGAFEVRIWIKVQVVEWRWKLVKF